MTLVFQETLLGIYITKSRSHPYHLFIFNDTHIERVIVPAVSLFLSPSISGLLLGINCHLIKRFLECSPQISMWTQCSVNTCILIVFIFAWINDWHLPSLLVLGLQALPFKLHLSVLTSSVAKLGAIDSPCIARNLLSSTQDFKACP